MLKKDIKSELNKILNDVKNGMNAHKLMEKYGYDGYEIDGVITLVKNVKFEGRIPGVNCNDHKIMEYIGYNIVIEDIDNMYDCAAWVESKVYNYIEHDDEYIIIYEI